MSERGGGGGTPGNPPRIPGIPSNASIDRHIFEFRTLNAQRPRPSIQDQEMAWCQNLMPVGAYYLRAIPDKSSPLYGSVPPFMSYAVAFGTDVALPIAVDRTSITNGVLLVPAHPTCPPYFDPPLITSNSGVCGPMTTAHPNEIIVIWISADGPATGGSEINPPVVQSIEGGDLVFKKRFATTATIASSYNAYATSIFAAVEEWWAVAGSPLTNVNFTVTFENVVESAVFGAFGVVNANLGDPWDTTTVTADNIHNNSGPATLCQVGPLSTSTNNDLVFSFWATYNNNFGWGYDLPNQWGAEFFIPTQTTFWENAAIMFEGANSCGDWNQTVGYYNTYSSPQVNITPYAFSGDGASGATNFPCWIGAADAIKGSNGNPAKLTNSNLGFPTSASTFLFACWIKMSAAGSFALMEDIVPSSGIQINVQLAGVWKISVTAWDANDESALSGTVNAGVDLSNGWHSIAISVNTVTETIQWMVDGSVVSTAGVFDGLPIVSGPNDTWQIGGNQSAEVDLSQLWFAIGQPFVDLTNSDNVHALFGNSNCVQNWGVRGELITGLSPQVFLFGPAENYANNYGSGGMFSAFGLFGHNGTPPLVCG